MGEVTDNHKMVFMFEFVQKVNEITFNKKHSSSKCVVGNLGWSIVIERKSSYDDGEFEYLDSDWKGFLSVQVNCGGESKLWCSYARIHLFLISQKEGLDDYSREFENLFSEMNPAWGYSEFIEWDKVIDPANGYVKDNVLKFRVHVVADIPQQSTADTSRDMPVEHEDWLAVFEGSLNDKIVGRICGEFIRMNTVIEKALTNEEISEKIIGAAVDPIKIEIRSEIQALEKRLEKFCANYIAKVIREMKSVKENVASGSATNDVFEGKGDYESKTIMNGNDTTSKKVHTAEEETVPVSVLKIMKELIVEQQRTSFGSWIPSVYGTRAAYYRTNEVRSYQPDAVCEAEEFRLKKGPLQPLAYDNNSESLDASHRQPADIAANAEMKRGSENQFPGTAQSQLRKNEKRKNEDLFESKGDEMSAKISKSTTMPDEIIPDQADQELLFLGKNADGKVEIHKVYHSKQLLELKKKYDSFKIVGSDEF